jgi:hypothetical protein
MEYNHPDWVEFCWKDAYEQNPIYLLHTFLHARDAGVQVPEWVLDRIGKAFSTYLEDKAITLDAALGLVTGRGKPTVRSAASQVDRDWEIVSAMDALIRLGMEVMDAAAVATEYTRLLSPPAPESARDMFYRWKSRLDSLAQKDSVVIEVSVNGDKRQTVIAAEDEVRAFLRSKFILESAPDEIRKKYPTIFTV